MKGVVANMGKDCEVLVVGIRPLIIVARGSSNLIPQ